MSPTRLSTSMGRLGLDDYDYDVDEGPKPPFVVRHVSEQMIIDQTINVFNVRTILTFLPFSLLLFYEASLGFVIFYFWWLCVRFWTHPISSSPLYDNVFIYQVDDSLIARKPGTQHPRHRGRRLRSHSASRAAKTYGTATTGGYTLFKPSRFK